jgi:hypothetical protein
MTKIIACSELRYNTLTELEALFRTLQIELGRTAPGSRERHRACQPRQRPPRHGGAPGPASEAVSAGAGSETGLRLAARTRHFSPAARSATSRPIRP